MPAIIVTHWSCLLCVLALAPYQHERRRLSDKSAPLQVLDSTSPASYTKDAHDSPQSPNDADSCSRSHIGFILYRLKHLPCCVAPPCASPGRICIAREGQDPCQVPARRKADCCRACAQIRACLHPRICRDSCQQEARCHAVPSGQPYACSWNAPRRSATGAGVPRTCA